MSIQPAASRECFGLLLLFCILFRFCIRSHRCDLFLDGRPRLAVSRLLGLMRTVGVVGPRHTHHLADVSHTAFDVGLAPVLPVAVRDELLRLDEREALVAIPKPLPKSPQVLVG